MKDGKMKKHYGNKQDVHKDKTNYGKLDHDKRTHGRGENKSYDELQKLVKTL